MRIRYFRRGTAILFVLLLLIGSVSCAEQNDRVDGTDAGADQTTEHPGTEPEEPNLPDGKVGLIAAVDGRATCRVVYPDNGGTMFADYAQVLADTVKKQIGVEPPVIRESNLKKTDSPTFYIGVTDAFRKTGEKWGNDWGDWRILSDGMNFYVVAATSSALSRAVTVLNGRLRKWTEDDGIHTEAFESSGSVALTGIEPPFFNSDKTVWCYGTGDGVSCKAVIADADETVYRNYLSHLTELSYTAYSEKESVAGITSVFTGNGRVLFANLLGEDIEIVSILESHVLMQSNEIPQYEKICDTTGYLLGVKGNGSLENGMSMIYLLADGSFLIYDMGNFEEDADQLYRTLCKIAEEKGVTTIRIAAWFVTHCHGDHIGGFPDFMKKYGDKVTIEHLMLNQTSPDQGVAYSPTAEQKVSSAVLTYSPKTKIIQLQTGQVFRFADVQIEILYTLTDLRQGTFTDYNDSSSVMRLTINGKNVLMTGDAAPATWGLLIKRYGASLKADYLQVPHHGAQPGGTIAAYDLIKPEYLLWPAGKSLYDSSHVQNAESKYLAKMVDSKKLFLAGSIGSVTEVIF